MGFSKVYKSLQTLFPQIDIRLLKAFAIEHSKDADAAAEAVIMEILPFLSKEPITPMSPPENQGLAPTSNGEAGREMQSIVLKGQEVVENTDAGSSSKTESVAGENAHDIDSAENVPPSKSRFLYEEALDHSAVSNASDAIDGHEPVRENAEAEVLVSFGEGKEDGPNLTSEGTLITLVEENDANNCHDQLVANNDTEELILFGKCQDNSVKVASNQMDQVSTELIHENGGASGHLGEQHEGWEEFDLSLAKDMNTVAFQNDFQKQSFTDALLEKENSVSLSSVQEHATDALDCFLQSVIDSGAVVPQKPETNVSSDFTHNQVIIVDQVLDTETEPPQKPETNVSSDFTHNQVIIVDEVLDTENANLNSAVTRSGQFCSVDLLEDIIEDAKSNKKILFSAMESLINMMEEVELTEKVAEEAKLEAARAGLDILSKVEDLKKLLQHAKEANDMHSGEIYGEKSILATEARELQSRLLNLSDERDKSLSILDEMRQTLEMRLAAAEEERNAAELLKLEKQESALRALAEQEDIMEKVVQQSQILQQEAEENSKLREFLVDRGRVVDALQGEIYVICQDVRSLKEKFDENVPLSKSVSSSQTSCILASSSSSLRSVASVRGESAVTPKKTSPEPSLDGQSPRSSSGEKNSRDYRKALLDDGWDLFDNDGDEAAFE